MSPDYFSGRWTTTVNEGAGTFTPAVKAADYLVVPQTLRDHADDMASLEEAGIPFSSADLTGADFSGAALQHCCRNILDRRDRATRRLHDRASPRTAAFGDGRWEPCA